jgi:hypothetical protein
MRSCDSVRARVKDEDEYTITHGGDHQGFMLFSYKVKKFSSKKKVRFAIRLLPSNRLLVVTVDAET